jgi:hypothetical protein
MFLRFLLSEGVTDKLSVLLGIQVHLLTLLYHEVVLFVVIVTINN